MMEIMHQNSASSVNIEHHFGAIFVTVPFYRFVKAVTKKLCNTCLRRMFVILFSPSLNTCTITRYF